MSGQAGLAEKKFVIKNKLGLHARPAALFVQTANRFKCEVEIVKGRQKVNGKSIMGVITLGATHDTQLMIVADGPDEREALDALEKLFENRFEED